MLATIDNHIKLHAFIEKHLKPKDLEKKLYGSSIEQIKMLYFFTNECHYCSLNDFIENHM